MIPEVRIIRGERRWSTDMPARATSYRTGGLCPARGPVAPCSPRSNVLVRDLAALAFRHQDLERTGHGRAGQRERSDELAIGIGGDTGGPQRHLGRAKG